jgi:filamentous hemagglutinin family protein
MAGVSLMKYWISYFEKINNRTITGVLLPLCLGLAWGNSVNAQVIPDGTLSTTVNAIGSDFTITGGNTAGTNLYHSFSQFSIPTGGSASFSNAITIENIFARVTGGSTSNIDGLLQTNGTANLFLLNPSGILFGPNATLNISGSFVTSTADSVLFEDGQSSVPQMWLLHPC